MFRESDLEWLRIIGCMKKAGMSIRDIRQYIELAMKGNNTIDARLEMFRRQRKVLEEQMAELQHKVFFTLEDFGGSNLYLSVCRQLSLRTRTGASSPRPNASRRGPTPGRSSEKLPARRQASLHPVLNHQFYI